jgi:hypothetical protein
MLRSIQKAEAHATHVLSICDDDGLRLSKELLLLEDGYKIVSIQSNAALTVSRVRSFDVALICRSVNRERAIPLVEMLLGFHPAIQILAIKPLDPPPDLCDADLEVPSGPQALLNEIRSFLQQRTANPSRMTSALRPEPIEPLARPTASISRLIRRPTKPAQGLAVPPAPYDPCS